MIIPLAKERQKVEIALVAPSAWPPTQLCR